MRGRGAFLNVVEDLTVLDMDDPVGKGLQARVVGDADHRRTVFGGGATQQPNDDLAIFTVERAGRIVRRYANPGSGASTLNVSNMFDLEPKTARIVRAELAESDLPFVTVGQTVLIVPDADPTHPWTGKVVRRSYQFGARKLLSDDPSEKTDERVVEVVASAEGSPYLIGQRVLVKFLKPGHVPPPITLEPTKPTASAKS